MSIQRANGIAAPRMRRRRRDMATGHARCPDPETRPVQGFLHPPRQARGGQPQPIAASIRPPPSSSTLACPGVSAGAVPPAASMTARPNSSSMWHAFAVRCLRSWSPATRSVLRSAAARSCGSGGRRSSISA